MIDLLAYIGGIFAMVSFLPQIRKSFRTRSTRDLSWGMLLTTGASALFYEAYAIALGLTPVMIMNGIFFVSVLCALGLKWHFDNAPGSAIDANT